MDGYTSKMLKQAIRMDDSTDLGRLVACMNNWYKLICANMMVLD